MEDPRDAQQYAEKVLLYMLQTLRERCSIEELLTRIHELRGVCERASQSASSTEIHEERNYQAFSRLEALLDLWQVLFLPPADFLNAQRNGFHAQVLLRALHTLCGTSPANYIHLIRVIDGANDYGRGPQLDVPGKQRALLRQHVLRLDCRIVAELGDYSMDFLRRFIFSDLSIEDAETFGDILQWFLSVVIQDASIRREENSGLPWQRFIETAHNHTDYVIRYASNIKVTLTREHVMQLTKGVIAGSSRTSALGYLENLAMYFFLLDYADVEAIQTNLSEIQHYLALCAKAITRKYDGLGISNETERYTLTVREILPRIKPALTSPFLQKIVQNSIMVPEMYHSVVELIQVIKSRLDPPTMVELNASILHIDVLSSISDGPQSQISHFDANSNSGEQNVPRSNGHLSVGTEFISSRQTPFDLPDLVHTPDP
ncbi:hypothetical protein K474DRAFT_1296724 [Panus rudis PR-1116 ss-1]|nr:hypothetical protein K474DRAFT_1296724 [Panus rudis PR-1116 ss-1]